MAEDPDAEFYETIEIHNRQFQRYSIEKQIYFVPVDDEEEARLDNQHKLFFYVFSSRHFEPDIGSPRRILDCGYGLGTWAVQMAEDYPDAQVVAYDIHPVDHLSDGPENLTAEICDLNERLMLSRDEEPFDFIHSRCVGGGIRKSRWDSYIRDLRAMLRPGGYVQLAEYYLLFQSDNGKLDTTNPGLYRWSQMYFRVMESYYDRDPRIGRKLADKLRSQRFRHVRSKQYKIPIGPWHEDALMRSIGQENIANIDQLLDSHSIYPFTNAGPDSWTARDVENNKAWAVREINDPGLKLYVVLYVAWGQR
ncbi:uncharacterized protein PV09_03293 [Verruconis gallopava]|uniref:Methyltransferase domain-containing protein n=1 Tax=Verruconis gallopava TaxID=253628 RepID=A0A0D2AGT3_9PEZI|nr:uncharacterized protein PV09_03293 [Verruconis gallopava]KIW06128.1 hypothetical protein PV09_03293 [Verruconis gallopava]